MAQLDFEETYRKHFRGTVNFFLRKGMPLEEAKELAQDVFVRVYRYREGYAGRASEKTWLKVIAENVFRNELRHRQAAKRPQWAQPSDASKLDAALQGLPEPTSIGEGALGTMIQEQESTTLLGAIQQLPPRMRQCMLLHLRELSYKEIARSMRISQNTVKRQVFDAKEKLRELLPNPRPTDGGQDE